MKNIDDLFLSIKNNTRRDVLLPKDDVYDIVYKARSSSAIVAASKKYRVVYITASILIVGIVLFSLLNKGSAPISNANSSVKEDLITATSILPVTDLSPKPLESHSRRDIVNHIVKIPDTKAEEGHVSVSEDNISSFGYIMLSSQELTDLKNAVPGASEITESLSNRIIPIHVKNDADHNAGNFLWYYPTKEFIAALPDRYRKPLEKELAVIEEAERKNLCAGDVCQKLTAPSFFDYCRSQSGVIERSSLTTISAQKETTAELDLSESRTISVSVYDQSGKFISKILTGRSVEAGIQKVNIDLNGLSKGAYLLAISTEKGEQVIQRIIVQ